jgi:hypothetical protein
MTPLNSISNNTGVIKKRIAQLYSEMEQINQGVNFNCIIQGRIDDFILQRFSPEARKTLILLNNIEESAKIMLYYNTN